MPPFGRVLVANRGEIAIRVIRACRELGISPVAVHSEADADALHVRLADASELIGPAPAADSYLSVNAIVDAARRSGAAAVHPGYGFLSENAAFAQAVEDAGIVFIGPPAATLEMLGNKLAARQGAERAGVPIVPGTTVALEGSSLDIGGIGFPLMLKAAAGGGGRGMRRVERTEEIEAALDAARREALAAFGDGTVYAERVIAPARHVEVQLLGDRRGSLAVLGERDCSIQRRHQKLVEESPAPGVNDAARSALFESARRVAGIVEFHNAATVEFLLDADGNHYFLEMNTRLQVEHGVTELVTGLDLVAWQMKVAAGERLPPDVLTATSRGHAIEVRLYAEDPYDGFRPVAGRVTAWRMPSGPGIRVDAGMEADTDLRPEYDPLLAKLIVHSQDRDAALNRLRRAIDETVIGGVQTDLGFMRWLVDDDAFVRGEFDTGFVAARWGGEHALESATAELAAAAALGGRQASGGHATSEGPARAPAEGDAESAWGRIARREALRG